MSEPSLLEYHLLSRHPFCGSLSKRFGISAKVWGCPTLPVLRQKPFAFSFTNVYRLLRYVFRGFRYPLSFFFPFDGAALFQQIFTVSAVFQPEDTTSLAQLS